MVRAVMERLVLFHYDQGSRAGAVIESLANRYNFKGYLQCDGFAGYETAFKTNPDVLLINCMVHIRRHLEQALDDGRLLLDNNLAENEIRPVTLGRKRSTFGRFAMQRTISFAATMRQHRTWLSSAHCWQHAGTMMSIRETI